MVFLWQLFLLLIIVALYVALSGTHTIIDKYGEKKIYFSWWQVLIIAVPMIYMAGIRRRIVSDFGDTTAYYMSFRDAPTSLSELFASFTDDTKDKGFELFTTIVKSVIGNREVVYFSLIAAISIFCVFAVYKKYSINFIFSVFLFLASADYIQWIFNGIRQFIAVAIIFACTGLILKKKYVPVIIIILLASTLHASALLMLPMIFIVQGKALNKKTILFAGSVILAIAFVDQFTNVVTNFMANTQYSNEVNQYLSTEGTSIQRVLVYSVPAILTIVFKKYIDRAKNPIVNLSSNMCFCAAMIMILSSFTSGLFLGRLGIYFSLYNYIQIPWIIENVFEKRSAKLVYCIVIGLYMIYYYFQVNITWGL